MNPHRGPAVVDDPILEGLNPAQREAVLHDTGPLLIVAGAGTGKTSVITRRIAHLIAAKKALPREILALTFTDKAAAEMEERVDVLVPYGFNDVWISTFHAFGDRILREQALEVGLSPDFQVLTRSEAAVFLRHHLFDLPLDHYRPLGNPTRYLHALLGLFSRAKDEDVSPEEYLAYAAGLETNAHSEEDREEARRQRELAAAYRTYEALKAKEGLVDFGDQVLQTLHLFRRRPSVLHSYQERFKYILVDEFQDTNYAQFELVKLLAQRHGNLVVVGDDDQAVFKFRGACLSNILQFLQQYPQARQIVLTENYRSTQVILDAAYRLIVHNNPERLEVRQRLDKRLHAQTTANHSAEPLGGERQARCRLRTDPAVRHEHFDTLAREAEAVAQRITEKVQQGEAQYRDCAILVRANDTAAPFLKALNMQGIPWRFSGASGLYAKEEIRLLLAFLRVVADPYDSASLHYLASSPLYAVPPLDLTRLTHLAHKSRRPLIDILQRYEEEPDLPGLSLEAVASLTTLRQDVAQYLKEAQERTASEVLYLFLKSSGILTQLARSEASVRDVERAHHIAQFFEQVRRFGDIAEYDRVHACVEYLDTLLHAGEDPPASEVDAAADEVQVLTLHKAKGLEFKVVFLVGLVEGKFPAQDRSEPIPLPDPLVRDILPVGDIHLQEERRLFYVGMTRAKRALYLTSARDYGGKRARKSSRFVLEALDVPRVAFTEAASSPREVLERFAPPAVPADSTLAPIPDDELLTLKATAIDDYLTCPLKYKFVHILRVPVLRHHAAVYGNAVHEALKAYHQRKLSGQTMTEAELLQVLKDHWISEGFVSREHEEQRFRQGQETLRRYLQAKEAEGFVPQSAEEEFRLRLDQVQVIGRWDCVVEGSAGGSERTVTIVDFKTSDTVRKQEDADRRVKESLQLLIYALGYQAKYGRLPDAVELHFLEVGLIGHWEPGPQHLEKAKAQVHEAEAAIRTRQFPAKPSYFTCTYCAYQNICPAVYSRWMP